MFENFDFSKMGEVLEAAQKQAQELEEEASKKEFTAKSGGGMVKVSINGHGEVTDINIDDSLLEDKESLQILLISAVNDAYKMVEDDKKHSATKLFSKMSGFAN